MTPAEIVSAAYRAGLVGAGGAGFPTHLKLAAAAEILIANGAECEPLLSVDKELLKHHPREVLDGLALAAAATGARATQVAIKYRHLDVFEALGPHLGGHKTSGLQNIYPAGDEQVLVYEVTGRTVPAGGLPRDVGVLVQNVATLLALSRAAAGRPFTHRPLTIGGEVPEPVTLWAPLGTPFRDLLVAVGVKPDRIGGIIIGGPMMGSLTRDLDEVVVKTTNGLLVLPPGHRLLEARETPPHHLARQAAGACDQCNFCTAFCPRHLLGHPFHPHLLLRRLSWGQELTREDLATVFSCCECGVCSALWACPVNLFPNRLFAQLKREAAAAGLSPVRAPPSDIRPERNGRLVPIPKLIERLDLASYDRLAPLSDVEIKPAKVRLRLQQHIGPPSRPVVAIGDRCRAGDPVAEAVSPTAGARVHASIDGTVAEISAREIVLVH